MTRRWTTMTAQGAIAAYLLGILIAGTWNALLWSDQATVCAVCFFVGWTVRLSGERKH